MTFTAFPLRATVVRACQRAKPEQAFPISDLLKIKGKIFSTFYVCRELKNSEIVFKNLYFPLSGCKNYWKLNFEICKHRTWLVLREHDNSEKFRF